MRAFRLVVFVAAFAVQAAVGSASDATDKLLTRMGMEQMVQLMHDEGVAYSVELGNEMLPGGYTDSWGALVARLYDRPAMEQSVRNGFAAALEGTDLSRLEAFFASETGETIVRLELSAREAMMDVAIEEAAEERARAHELAGDDIFLAIDAFVEAGDLLEANVVGALNSNIQFYRGLVEGGAFQMSEADIIADVWSQEELTRSETRDWLYGFLIMAYAPLDPDQLADYMTLASSPEGKAMTAALFQGFDGMYADISYALGLAAAQAMRAEDI